MNKKKILVGVVIALALILAGLNAYRAAYKASLDPEEQKVLGESSTDTSIIYQEDETQNQLSTEKLDLQKGQFDETSGSAIPKINDLLLQDDYDTLYSLLPTEVLAENGWVCERVQLENKLRDLLSCETDAGFILQPHGEQGFIDYVVVNVSILPAICGENGEQVFDYEKAKETTFTIYPKEDGSFNWLPFNIKEPGASLEYMNRTDITIKEEEDIVITQEEKAEPETEQETEEGNEQEE